MDIVYRISAKDLVAYARNIADCDKFCAELINNGAMPKVRRISRKDVPLNEIELVNQLLTNKQYEQTDSITLHSRHNQRVVGKVY